MYSGSDIFDKFDRVAPTEAFCDEVGLKIEFEQSFYSFQLEINKFFNIYLLDNISICDIDEENSFLDIFLLFYTLQNIHNSTIGQLSKHQYLINWICFQSINLDNFARDINSSSCTGSLFNAPLFDLNWSIINIKGSEKNNVKTTFFQRRWKLI